MIELVSSAGAASTGEIPSTIGGLDRAGGTAARAAAASAGAVARSAEAVAAAASAFAAAADPFSLLSAAGLTGAGLLTGERRPQRARSGAGYAAAKTSTGAAASTSNAAKTTSSSASAKAAGSSTSSSTSSSSTGPLAFLSDPKLSVEEKLYRFMLYASDQMDKQLQAKLDEIDGKQKSSSSSSSSSGGLLGGLGKAVGGILGNSTVRSLVTQATGPVLAAGVSAMGFPELAPAALAAGPSMAKGALSLVDSATGTGSSSGSGTSKTSTTYSSASDPQIEQKDMLELQHLMDKQKEMFSTVSEILKSLHDTKMTVIGNVR